MALLRDKNDFLVISIGVFALFACFLILSIYYEVYRFFPAYGFIGYSAIILGILIALYKAWQPWHYVTVSISLIVFGTIASLDLLLSEKELWIVLNSVGETLLGYTLMKDELNDYTNVLLILLNVFTSSIAGNALFYGLNQRNFRGR